MMIPNASRSPPRTWATTWGSERASLTTRGTRAWRVWSRGWNAAGQDFAGGAQERGCAHTRPVDAAGERLEGGLRAAAIRGIAGRFGQPQQEPRGPGVRAWEDVVEDLLGAIRQCRSGGIGRRRVVVAAERVSVIRLEHGGEVARDGQVARVTADLVRGDARA